MAEYAGRNWLRAASRARSAKPPRACTTADIRRVCRTTLVAGTAGRCRLDARGQLRPGAASAISSRSVGRVLEARQAPWPRWWAWRGRRRRAAPPHRAGTEPYSGAAAEAPAPPADQILRPGRREQPHQPAGASRRTTGATDRAGGQRTTAGPARHAVANSTTRPARRHGAPSGMEDEAVNGHGFPPPASRRRASRGGAGTPDDRLPRANPNPRRPLRAMATRIGAVDAVRGDQQIRLPIGAAVADRRAPARADPNGGTATPCESRPVAQAGINAS